MQAEADRMLQQMLDKNDRTQEAKAEKARDAAAAGEKKPDQRV
jgi:hypothetical protein